MKAYLKSSFSEKTQVLDKETGEIINEEIIKHTYITKDKEDFFLVYSSLIGLLGELTNPAIKVLSYILLNYKINSQFEIGGISRNLIAQKMNLGKSSVANALTELKENNILYSPMKSVYQINPRYAYQGSTSDRKEALKTIIELGCKDC